MLVGIFFPQFCTFLDILAHLAKQNGGVYTDFEIQLFSLKQYKQIVIYQFSLQANKNMILLWCRSQFVKNNSQINETTPMSCMFVGWKNSPLNPTYGTIGTDMVVSDNLTFFFIWAAPCENALSGICRQWNPGQPAHMCSQSDKGLNCLLTESLDIVEYFNGQQRQEWYLAHMQDDGNPQILCMF